MQNSDIQNFYSQPFLFFSKKFSFQFNLGGFFLSMIIFCLFLYFGVQVYKSLSNKYLHSYFRIWVVFFLLTGIINFISVCILFKAYLSGVDLAFFNGFSAKMFISSRVGVIFLIYCRPKYFSKYGLKMTKDEVVFWQQKNKVKLIFEQEFFNNSYFLNAEASQENFCKVIGARKEELISLLKEQETSFIELVNKNRVDYIISLMQKDEYQLYTQEALAKEAGFGTYQSMNYAFQKFKGQNFSLYKKSVSH